MGDRGEGNLKLVTAVICIVALAAGGTVIGRWAGVGCTILKGFACPAQTAGAPGGTPTSNDGYHEPTFSDGYYEIEARHSGKCLDVAWGSLADSEPVNQFTCKDSPNQQWSLAQAS